MQTDLERLQAEISRLMAALEDVNFECQRLEIVNKNLDFQLKEANRELRQNIAVLEALESEIARCAPGCRSKSNGIQIELRPAAPNGPAAPRRGSGAAVRACLYLPRCGAQAHCGCHGRRGAAAL